MDTSSESKGRGFLKRWAGPMLAVLGGTITWGIVESVHPVFFVPKEYEAPDIGMPAEVYAKNRWARERVERHHAMLYVGLLGGLVGGAIGLGTGHPLRRVPPAVLAAGLGVAGGVTSGHFASRVHEYVYEHFGQPTLQHTILEQIVLLVPLGLAMGLGWGLGVAGGWKALSGSMTGALAGLAAAFLYPVAVSLLLPGASTDMLLPMEHASRALWFILVSGVLGLILPLGASKEVRDDLPSDRHAASVDEPPEPSPAP